MMEDLSKMKERINALLAKANDTSVTEEEADAFNTKANELMVKYNIERVELQEEEQDIERIHISLEVQLRPWSKSVLSGLTKLYFCTYFSQKLDHKGRKHRVTIVGEKQNAMVCHRGNGPPLHSNRGPGPERWP